MNEQEATVEADRQVEEQMEISNVRNQIIREQEAIEERRLQVLEQEEARAIKEQAKNTNSEGDLPFTTFALMLGTAIFFDVLTALINLLPLGGGIISSFILEPFIILTFWIWCKSKGINFTKGSRGILTAVTLIIGFIPIINALPEWTLAIIMLKVTSKSKRGLKQIAGK